MDVKTKGKLPSKESINYSAVFSGEVLVDIVAVNPDRETYIKLKGLENIADQIDEPQYTNIELGDGNEYTKLEFWGVFRPNEVLKTEGKYPETIAIPYPIFIRDDYVFNKAKDKIQVIDTHNQSAWIPYEEGKSVKELIESVKEQNESIYIQRLDADNARHAKVGEVLMYDFLFNITSLRRHDPDNENENRRFELDGFAFGEDPSDTFSNIVNGDFGTVREFLDIEYTRWPEGSKVLVGLFLGARESSDGEKLYQEVLSHPMTVCTFKEKTGVRTQTNNGIKMTTRLSNEAYERLTNQEYGWRHHFAHSAKLQEFTADMIKEEKSDLIPGEVNDDLPF